VSRVRIIPETEDAEVCDGCLLPQREFPCSTCASLFRGDVPCVYAYCSLPAVGFSREGRFLRPSCHDHGGVFPAPPISE
jgi:hypothetical protein